MSDCTSTTTTQSPIASAIGDPLRVKTEEGEVQEHSLRDKILADRYLRGIENCPDEPNHGLRISKMKPPGTT